MKFGRRQQTTAVLALTLLAGLVSTPTLYGALPLAVSGEKLPSLAPILETTTPAVVNISTETRIRAKEHPLLSDPFFRHFFDLPTTPRERRSHSLGSGVVVDARRGYVVTNHHVIDKAERITVTLQDGRNLGAELLGADPETDIAILKVPTGGLTATKLGDSDELRVGDFVVAIGNPFGLGQTVTSGIVSALGRSGLGIEGYEDFIQTDASINPGNSGGALINLRGELVGINAAIYAPGGGNIGIGFAIPVNMVRAIMEQIVEHGAVRRGRLGAQAQDLTPELAAAFGIEGAARGAVVTRVISGSPADKADLKVGDVITEVNGRRVDSMDDLRTAIGLLRVGDTVQLTVLRNGGKRHIKTKVAANRSRELPGKLLHPRLAGLALKAITEDSPLYGRIEGVLVADVQSGSRAWGAGLRKGDVITSVNRFKVTSPEQAVEAARGNSGTLLLNIRRGESALFLLIQ